MSHTNWKAELAGQSLAGWLGLERAVTVRELVVDISMGQLIAHPLTIRKSLGYGTVLASLELASARMACWQAGLSMADKLAAI